MRMSKGRWGMAAMLATLAFWTGAAAADAKLTVYTALEADDLKKYKARFEQEVKGIDIQWVRDSTGIITAKLLAEKAAPQADVVMGVAVTSLILLDAEGMLEPYAPTGLEKLAPA